MRRIFLNLKIAVESLLTFKLRTALAVLGVFLGTFALIVVSNVSGSLAKKTDQEISSLGKNLLIVRSGIVRRFGPGTRLLGEATTLKLEDAEAIMDGAGAVSAVSPTSNRSFQVSYGNVKLTSVLVVGATPSYADVRNFLAERGSFITDDDVENSARVAVIGQRVAEKLFGEEDPLGKSILIVRVPCRIIGVMESKGVDISGVDQDNQIFVPLTTFMRRFINKDYIGGIHVQVADAAAMERAKAEIEQILRKRHKIGPGQKDDFTVIDLKDVMALQTQAMETITVLGRISAVVAFAIGGIGILSIMILIVNERRIEIGIRRAVGSRKRDIMIQFLVESSFISLAGGTVGVLGSLLVSILIFLFSGLPFVLSPQAHVTAFVASVLIGILAGIYPSKKAIAIQPVDIIRA